MGSMSKEDPDKKAKGKCIEILEYMELRSINSAVMCYELSSTYDSRSTFGAIGVSLLLGIFGRRIPKIAGRFTNISKISRQQHKTAPSNGKSNGPGNNGANQSGNGTGNEVGNLSKNGTANGYHEIWSQVNEFVIVPVTISGLTFSLGSRFLFEEWRAKAKAYNKAGAAWQRLELDISRFLAVSDDNTPLEKYNEVTDEFTKRREEICLIAKPEQKVYRKFHDINNPGHALNIYKKKTEFLAKMKEYKENMNKCQQK